MVHNFGSTKRRTSFPKSSQSQTVLAGIVVISLLIGGGYLRSAWKKCQATSAQEAVKFAQTLEIFLPKGPISRLIAEPEDPQAHEFIEGKLTQLVASTPLLDFACLLAKRNDQFFILADSHPKKDSVFLPLGDLQEKLLENSWQPFFIKHGFPAQRGGDHPGAWFSAFVPLRDSLGDEGGAVFGLCYNHNQWKKEIWQRMTAQVLIALSLPLLFSTLVLVWQKSQLSEEKDRELALAETAFCDLLERVPFGVVLNVYDLQSRQFQIKKLNSAAREILGVGRRDARDVSWEEILDPQDFSKELQLFSQVLQGERDSYSLKRQLTRPDGTRPWIKFIMVPFLKHRVAEFVYLTLLEDITAARAAKESLLRSERSKRILLSYLPGMVYRCRADRERTLEFVSQGSFGLTGYRPPELLHGAVVFGDLISQEYRRAVRKKQHLALALGQTYQLEYELLTKKAERKWVLELGQGVYNEEGSLVALEGVILDISERKSREAEISYLKTRDLLTGLYNRSFLEQEMKRLNQAAYRPVGVVVGDIDGLRIINDAYGYSQGDQLIRETADLIQSCLGQDHVLGRVGGGEFVLFLPFSNQQETGALVEKIHRALENYNQNNKSRLFKLSLTMGYCVVEKAEEKIEEALKKARLYLKHRKLFSRESSQHSILSSILAGLYAKSQETEEHGQRIGEYAVAIGRRLGLKERLLDDLRLLSVLHDIGKIGVNDQILNKPGKLTVAEWQEIKTHPEIGERIVASIPELEHIAEYILHHHEWWDGSGYPAGLKGSQIPLLARILSLADAYDAMTENRVYRRALPPQAAREEIKRGAGTQFDPHLVELFLEVLKEENGPNLPPRLGQKQTQED